MATTSPPGSPSPARWGKHQVIFEARHLRRWFRRIGATWQKNRIVALLRERQAGALWDGPGPSPAALVAQAWAQLDGAPETVARPTTRHPNYSPARIAQWPTDQTRRLWFHAGAHKTATTSLQISMAINAPRLAERGVVVLPQFLAHQAEEFGTAQFYRSEFRRRITSLARAKKKPTKARRQQRLRELRSFVGPWALDAPTIVLSDEDLLGKRLNLAPLPYPRAREHVATVDRVFRNHELHVVLYVRDLGAYVDACYVQSLKMRRPAHYEEWARKVDFDRLSWLRVAHQIARRVGDERLTIRRFESIRGGYEAFAHDFFSLFCDPTGLDLSARAANPSLSKIGCELALAIAPIIDDRDEWQLVRRFLEDHFSGRGQPKARFVDDDTRARLSERYERELEKLRKRYGDFA